MRFLRTFLPALALLLAVFAPNGIAAAKPLRQGVQGRVLLYQGDHMPDPDGAGGTMAPVSRLVYLFELTHITQAKEVEPCFYSSVDRILVASVWSGADGRFQIEARPGRYSIFVKEKGLFYANRLDGGGYIMPVVVREGRVAEVEIEITHGAAF